MLVRNLREPTGCPNHESLQEWCESSRLGIPIIVSMDSVHGLSYINGGLVRPHNLGMAATRNADLLRV